MLVQITVAYLREVKGPNVRLDPSLFRTIKNHIINFIKCVFKKCEIKHFKKCEIKLY